MTHIHSISHVIIMLNISFNSISEITVNIKMESGWKLWNEIETFENTMQ